MKKFSHFSPFTLDEAIFWLERYGERAKVIAGGTDLLGKMKDEILPGYPDALINIKSIHGLDFIKIENNTLRIGALSRIRDIALNSKVKQSLAALAEAAHRTASPNIREMGTIGGNICQDIRCWYYRAPYNRFPCLRKGGGRCYAIAGDNRYHSIFGGSVEEGCYAVHPSDLASALIAGNARIKTTKRTISAQDFFQVSVCKTTVLDADEIVSEIKIPLNSERNSSSFMKFALRKSIDFSIVNCAAAIEFSNGSVSESRICMNGVSVLPYRAYRAEEAIMGKNLDDSIVEASGEAAVADAKPLTHNKYKVRIAQTLVKRVISACKESQFML